LESIHGDSSGECEAGPVDEEERPSPLRKDWWCGDLIGGLVTRTKIISQRSKTH